MATKSKELNRQHVAAHRARRKREVTQLLSDFATEFSSRLRFRVDPVEDADPDLVDPVRMCFVYAEDLRPELVAFAHARNMDIETMFDRITQAGMDNLFGKGKKFLVE